ncbi:MAG: clostripain-related cysteine peptidase [Elusimicrobiales bacterium]|nr:clostripain-related cysteine peptidase [Elusimicrobiales bacterium]
MFKKAVLSAVAVMFSAASLSAGINFDTPSSFDLKEAIANAEIAVPETAVEADTKGAKEWTIMVFLNSKNNLERFGLKDLNEMEMVGSSDKVNVVVEMGRMSGFDSSDGDWKGTRRYLVQKDDNTSKVTSPVIEDLGKTDMGDWKSLAAFGKWAKQKYPAKRYIMIVWNHGAGWIKSRGLDQKGISYDDETHNHITTPQLGWALRDMGGVDVYGSDACLMQMAEVVYEIKDYTQYIVGSEETEPGDGYTYDTFLSPIVAKPYMGAFEAGKVTVDAYSDHYASIRQASTQSLIKSSAIDGLLPVSNGFAAAVMASGEKELAKKAMRAAQNFAYSENKDLYHFAQLILAETQNQNVKAKGQALMSYIKSPLVVHNRTNNSSGGWYGPEIYDDAHGIAVYLPGRAAPAHYAELQWAAASNWDDFINWTAQ